jgi:hypothetical protein
VVGAGHSAEPGYGTTIHTDAVATPGLETKRSSCGTATRGNGWTTATTGYDIWGRPTTATDALGNTISTNYSHTTVGLVASSATSTPDEPPQEGSR